jgi:hypothetical protein
MYYPYFRGKQYELIAIRENADRISGIDIFPIIEPVKANVSGLIRTIEALVEHNIKFVLIANPQCGELCSIDSSFINELANDHLSEYNNFSLGYIVNTKTSLSEFSQFCNTTSHSISIIHYGYQHGRELADALNDLDVVVKEHIFIEEYCSRIYRRHFNKKPRVLIRDGFIKRKGREYPEFEHFSDLHITYQDEGLEGFGDFLIVGDDYYDTGGPAYTVAIHLSYIDKDEDDDMFIKHYISDRTSSPVDPGGKFLEALRKLVVDVKKTDSKIRRTDAVKEFLKCYKQEHYPGLGYVKKLSMQHHIELMASYLLGV